MGAFQSMKMGDGAEIAVYRAEAAGERIGGLVVIQEIFGVNDHIRAVADGYAKEGFEVLAPALFDREAPGFEVGYDAAGIEAGFKLARDLHPFEQSLADAQTCIDALKGSGPVFMVGYCYGGLVTWRSAQTSSDLTAASAYYGAFITTDFADQPPRCPTLAHFGRLDAAIPMEGVEALIARQHPNVEIYVYDADHGFNCDQRGSYHRDSAELARQRTLAFFRDHAGG